MEGGIFKKLFGLGGRREAVPGGQTGSIIDDLKEIEGLGAEIPEIGGPYDPAFKRIREALRKAEDSDEPTLKEVAEKMAAEGYADALERMQEVAPHMSEDECIDFVTSLATMHYTEDEMFSANSDMVREMLANKQLDLEAADNLIRLGMLAKEYRDFNYKLSASEQG